MTSSWQDYVNVWLVGSGKVSMASINGMDGLTWATCPGFTVSQDECQALLAGLSSADGGRLISNGLVVSQRKYRLVRHEHGRSLYGVGAEGDNCGVCVVKSSLAVIIGVYEGNILATSCCSEVEKLADYLISMQL